jgi:hypothetical protein
MPVTVSAPQHYNGGVNFAFQCEDTDSDLTSGSEASSPSKTSKAKIGGNGRKAVVTLLVLLVVAIGTTAAVCLCRSSKQSVASSQSPSGGAAKTVESAAEEIVATTTSEKDVEERAPKTRGTYYFSQEKDDSRSTDSQAGTSVSTVEEVVDLKSAEETSAEQDDNIESPIAVSDVKPRRGGNFLSRNKWTLLAGLGTSLVASTVASNAAKQQRERALEAQKIHEYVKGILDVMEVFSESGVSKTKCDNALVLDNLLSGLPTDDATAPYKMVLQKWVNKAYENGCESS